MLVALPTPSQVASPSMDVSKSNLAQRTPNAIVCGVILGLFGLLASCCAVRADSVKTDERVKAQSRIEACLGRDEASSRECNNLKQDIQTLVDAYHQGDKTALPTLLRFTILTDFFGETLIADPEGFLSEAAKLPETRQQRVAQAVAGLTTDPVGLARPRFDAIRAALTNVPESSPNYRVARECLTAVETNNASLLVDYFPPQTFAGRGGEHLVHWYSREMFALHQGALWPPVPANEGIYRVTVIPARAPSESATLKKMADGTGGINFRAIDADRTHLVADDSRTISAQQVSDFIAALDHSEFWDAPAEKPRTQFDGALWLLEAVQDGKYHIVVRWCPGVTPFGEAAANLFGLAGGMHHEMCGSRK